MLANGLVPIYLIYNKRSYIKPPSHYMSYVVSVPSMGTYVEVQRPQESTDGRPGDRTRDEVMLNGGMVWTLPIATRAMSCRRRVGE